jgi:MerR family transcriptional regulator/heat shock protein HspR
MKKAYYMIGGVSEMLALHPQTIRQYERQGLISPGRTRGNTRLYSEEDIERLKFILTLTRDMGINLAGVEMIVTLKDEIAKLEKMVEELNRRISERIGESMEKVSVRPQTEPVIIKVVKDRG